MGFMLLKVSLIIWNNPTCHCHQTAIPFRWKGSVGVGCWKGHGQSDSFPNWFFCVCVCENLLNIWTHFHVSGTSCSPLYSTAISQRICYFIKKQLRSSPQEHRAICIQLPTLAAAITNQHLRFKTIKPVQCCHLFLSFFFFHTQERTLE